MDRPRSLVQDAGLWLRSIQPLGCPPVAKHEERGRLPRNWERRPRSLAPIRLSCQGRPTQPPRLPPRRRYLGSGPWVTAGSTVVSIGP